MNSLSTHVLDLALGKPAAGVRVTLSRGGTDLGSESTDFEGRVRSFGALDSALSPGDYQLSFVVAEYFSKAGRECFFPEIVIRFTVGAGSRRYHVPLLLSPFGYSTYLGS
jgi:5-hydroxyisourate hydrolase